MFKQYLYEYNFWFDTLNLWLCFNPVADSLATRLESYIATLVQYRKAIVNPQWE